MRKLLPLLTLIAAFCVPVSAQSEDKIKTYDDPEAYAVFSAALQDEWTLKHGGPKRLLIVKETAPYIPRNGEFICLTPSDEPKAKYGAIIESYRKANKTGFALTSKFDLALPYDLVDASSIKAAFDRNKDDPWKSFLEIYPDSAGFIDLSAVGFNAGKTQALVYIGHACGSLCGGGRFHFLTRSQGKWTDVDVGGIFCEWVS